MDNAFDEAKKKLNQSAVPELLAAPAPVTQTPPTQTATIPQGNWATRAGAPTTSQNPYGDAFKSANLIASSMPATGLNMQMDASRGIGEAQSQGFSEQEKAIKDQEAKLLESQERIKNIQSEKEAAQKKFDADYDSAIGDLKATQIDNERLWKNKSTGQKIMTGIGLALSAFGGPEAVARTNQIIQSAVDKDIEEQKANYGIKKEGVNDMKNVYARMMDKFGDSEKAELATKAFYTDQLNSKIAQIGARTNSIVAKENAKNLMGQMQSQRDGLVGQLGMTLMSNKSNEGIQTDALIPDNYTPKTEEERKRFIRGVGLATDAEAAKQLRTDFSNFNQFNDKMGQLITMREKFGSETLPSEAKGIMKQLATEALLAKKSSAKLGVMSDSDRELLEDIVADPTSLNPNTLARFKKLQQTTLSDFSRNVQPSLLNPVESFNVNVRKGSF